MSVFRRSSPRQQIQPIQPKHCIFPSPYFPRAEMLSQNRAPSWIFTFSLEVNRVMPVKIAEIDWWHIGDSVYWLQHVPVPKVSSHYASGLTLTAVQT